MLRVLLAVQIDVDFTKCRLQRNGVPRRVLGVPYQHPCAGQIQGGRTLFQCRIKSGGLEGVPDLQGKRPRFVVEPVEDRDGSPWGVSQRLDKSGLLFRGNNAPLQLG